MFDQKRYQKMLKGKMTLVNTLSKILRTYKSEPFLQSEKGFFKLMNKHGICLFYQKVFSDTLRVKCKQLLNPQTLYFISPIVHKYFYDDQELVGLVRKVKNYNRHVKSRRKLIKNNLAYTSLCQDEISLVLEYV